VKTTLFASVSIDGLIANQDGIPLFPEGAWADWCALVWELELFFPKSAIDHGPD